MNDGETGFHPDLSTMLAAAGIGTWTWNPSTGEVGWDATARTVYGVHHDEFDGTFASFMAFIHPDDAPGVGELLDAVAGRGGEYSTKHRIIQPSGVVRWVEGQGRIVVEDGLPVAGFGVVYDITDRATLEDERDRLRIVARAAQAARTATEQDLAYLIEVSDALTGSLNVTKVLERLASFIVPGLADHCVIDMQTDDLLGATLTAVCGSTGKPIVSHGDSDAIVAQRLGLHLGSIEREVLENLVAREAHEPERTSRTSAVAIPIAARGTRVGMVLAERQDGQWTTRTESLINAIVRRAAVALENAMLFQAQSTVSNLLVSVVQPEHMAVSSAFEVATHYRAATEVTRLGGDFYDFFALSDTSWMVVVGDATGKGILAAARAGLIRAAVRSAALTCHDAEQTLHTINRILRLDPERPMATAVLARLDHTDGVYSYSVATAGHPAGMVVRPGSVTDTLAKGPLLGFVDDPVFDICSGELSPGDSLVLFSDGVTEARLGSEEFGRGRLADVAGSIAGEGAVALTRAIALAVEGWTSGRVQDDVTIVAATTR